MFKHLRKDRKNSSKANISRIGAPEALSAEELSAAQGGAFAAGTKGFIGKGRSSTDIIAAGNQIPLAKDGNGVWMQDWINNGA